MLNRFEVDFEVVLRLLKACSCSMSLRRPVVEESATRGGKPHRVKWCQPGRLQALNKPRVGRAREAPSPPDGRGSVRFGELRGE